MEIKFKRNFLSLAIMFATASAPTVYAQVDEKSTDSVDTNSQVVEEVVVTGSRIKRANLETASPITSVSAEDIELSGNISLGDYLNELPALRSTFSNNNSGRFIGTVGLNLLDLRGMGYERTLVLQDGRRHIGSSIGTSAVDVNTIPEDLLLRVDTVTGGQSAIYGADAVTGVVNFITRDDFEGLKVNLHHMQPELNGGEATEFSVTWGSNFAEGRGNVAVSFQHSQTAEVYGKDRPWIAASPGYQVNPADTGDDGIPDEILVFNTTNNLLSENGVIWGTHPLTTIYGYPSSYFPLLGSLASGPYTFTNDGQLVAFNPGEHPPGETTSVGGDGLNFISSTQLYPELDSQNYFAKAHYDLNESTRLFVEAKYSVNNAESYGQPSFDYFGDLVISADNAFVPAELKQELDDAGMTEFWYHRFHSDLGMRGDDAKREVQRYVLGIEGDLIGSWSYEAYAVYGQYDAEVDYTNNRHNARFFEAVDAVVDPGTGEIVCRSETARANGCLPINLFGYGLNSQEAIDYFMLQDTGSTENMTQTVFSASVTGDLFELPAGALSTAVGVEYREETSEVDYDQVIKDGETFMNALAPSSGEYDVSEVFFEVSAPLVEGLPGVDSLTLGASARFSDYSTIGATTTWGTSIDWAITEDVRIRATSSEAVRAPNIDELFSPLGQNYFSWEDPCSYDKIDEAPDPAQRAARCAELGVPADFNSVKDASSLSGLSGGNTELKEETAETITYGLAITPRFAPGLVITVDYWDMEITDAIDGIPAQEILERCVDSASINNIYCPLVPRDPSTGEVISLTSPLLNIASLTARGIDYQVDYSFELSELVSSESDWGSLKFSLLGTELLERNDYPFQDNPDDPDEVRGELGDPIRSYTTNVTYYRGDLQVNWRSRYIDDMLLIETDQRRDLQDPYKTPSIRYHDLQGRYKFADFEVYGGVNNIEDVEPPVGLSGTGGGSGIYNTLGRNFYLGINYTL
ncbi:TonB-dependent receptor plug domain-containing protein [Microbulbifer thermotolerans]|uniref:TonB-dependent receptor n=1 Tax=Microbulbifer thermotolerans TaxID=252514 RepID=A0AB35HZX3_MICTH|nr:TonB-dependent receptor [Microbulbifer thermotolerans]MCX2796378.1 TonB-dependent receptor [Microbulbifer thermotolerans]MCX2802583.1 TonB-dependent receptor [Microbulbifer thermotolerans]MCX2832766.1 TonB-dependent receptor [Microbulbifer thermotolerans]WKT60254.1 TonB-dependent receptor [Microbulbifer thermotolerans]SFD09504.1 Outer membrane cobalamin receptor protein [Microbulbifer thermotolerans]